MNSKISVVMSVYNGDKYLKESIQSILNQTFKEFELIIINDGSIDKSEDIIKEFSDNRIIYLKNKKNKGLIYSLNYGLSKAKGKYIARMDADDICYLNRFEVQYRYLEENLDVYLVGGQAKNFSLDKKEKMTKMPLEYERIKEKILFSNPFIHPTVMFRREIYDNGFFYNSDLKGAEDFGLWQEIIYKYKCINLPNILIKYRVLLTSETRIYDKKIEEKINVHKKIYRRALENIGVKLNDYELDIYTKCCIGSIDFKKNTKNKNLNTLYLILIKILSNYRNERKRLNKLIIYRYLLTSYRVKKIYIKDFSKLLLNCLKLKIRKRYEE